MLRIRPGNAREHRRTDDAHVAGEDDDIDRCGRERLREGRVGVGPFGRIRAPRPGSEGGVDPLLRRPVERRAVAVREDEHDLAAELAAAGRRGEGPQVAPGAGDADRDPAAHRSPTGTASGHAPWSRPSTYRAAELVRGDDLADEDRVRAGPAISAGDGLRGDDDHHPEPAVERRPELAVLDPAKRPEQAHDRGHPPAPRVEPRAEPARECPGHVAGQAAARDVGEAAEVVAGRPQRRAGRQDAPRVDPGRREQDLAESRERDLRARPRRPRRDRRRRASGRSCSWYGRWSGISRCAISARTSEKPLAWRPDAGSPKIASPASRGGPVEDVVALDDADARPGEVERAGLHEPGVLRRLPADERAARLAAARRPRRRRARRPSPGRGARPPRSRGTTSGSAPLQTTSSAHIATRSTPIVSQRRSAAAIAVFVPTPSVDETITGSR